MIVSAFAGVGKTTLAQEYKDDVIDLESGNFKWLNNENTESSKGTNRVQNPRYPINYLEAIKSANSKYKVVLVSQHEILRKCLDAVKLDYVLIYPDKSLKDEYIERYRARGNNDGFINLVSNKWDSWIHNLDNINNHNKIVLQSGQFLSDIAEQLGLEPKTDVSNTSDTTDANTTDENTTDVNTTDTNSDVKEQIVEEVTNEIVNNVDNSVDNLPQTVNKEISISDVMDNNFCIDDLTLRDFKVDENKIRAGMLIQAKNRLCRIDKLLNTLNKLEDELFDRIEDDVQSMRTDRIIEYTKFISTLIKDTNEMVMSVIGNPKLQNFFIVDNSSNVTVEDTTGLDINKRKRVRHAVQVVLENIDKVEEGKIEEVKSPNIIIENSEIQKEDEQNVNN